jgi:hypothetical protein
MFPFSLEVGTIRQTQLVVFLARGEPDFLTSISTPSLPAQCVLLISLSVLSRHIRHSYPSLCTTPELVFYFIAVAQGEERLDRRHLDQGPMRK